jgi:hypothetical protein
MVWLKGLLAFPGGRGIIPQDIIAMSKAVYKVRIGGIWPPAEVAAKVRKLLIKAGTDYLN